MGEVYRARDPRFGRDVALKLLRAEVAGDAERVKRFEQEARCPRAQGRVAAVDIALRARRRSS